MKTFADFLNSDEQRIPLKQDQQIFDSIDGSRYFRRPQDQTDTGYDQFPNILIQPNRTRYFLQKSIIAKLVPMTAAEYLSACSKARGHNPPKPNNEFKCCNLDKVYEIAKSMRSGVKMPIGIVNFANGNQDGRHRALAAYHNGATRIPVIVIEYASPQIISQLLQLPDNLYFSNGLIFDEHNVLVADVRNCDSIDEAVEVIKKAVYTRQISSIQRPITEGRVDPHLSTPNVYKTIFDGLTAASNACVEIGAGKHSRRIVCNPDKDNQVSLSFIQTYCNSDIDWGIFTNATIPLGCNYITFVNITTLIDAIYQFTMTNDIDRLKLILTDSQRSYYQQVALDPTAVEMFIRQIVDKFELIDINRTNQQIVCTIRCGSYNLVISVIGNSVKFELIVNDYYVDNIQITDDNCQTFIKDYNKLVANINTDINNTLTYVENFARQNKYNSLWIRLNNNYTNR